MKQNVYYFRDPAAACVLMQRRGYHILQDRATGVLFAKLNKFVHMQPDGEALALAQNYLPCWCADQELAETSDGKMVQE